MTYGYERKFWCSWHGISDSDTGELVDIEGGELYETQILGSKRSDRKAGSHVGE